MWGFAEIPLALILLFVALLLFGAMELGLHGHRWLHRRPSAIRTEQVVPDHLVSAMLGLLALLLGFTFSLALSRYEARRELVVEEANAIGTTWLRAQLLEEPARSRLSPLLRDYADVRLAWSHDAASVPKYEATGLAQQRLWEQMGFALRHDSSQQLTRGLMDAMNESFDLASARSAARMAHIPSEVLLVLLVCALLTALLLGYVMQVRRHRAATMLLLLLVAMTLTMIIDLERPVAGAIRVSQQPLVDLRASIH